jgi:hypothetical protein
MASLRVLPSSDRIPPNWAQTHLPFASERFAAPEVVRGREKLMSLALQCLRKVDWEVEDLTLEELTASVVD